MYHFQKLKAPLIVDKSKERAGCSNDGAGTSSHAMSKAIEVPRVRNGDKYSSLMVSTAMQKQTFIYTFVHFLNKLNISLSLGIYLFGAVFS